MTLGLDGVRVDPQMMWSRVSHQDGEIYDFKQLVHNQQNTVDAIPRGWHGAMGLNTFMLVTIPLVSCFVAIMLSLSK